MRRHLKIRLELRMSLTGANKEVAVRNGAPTPLSLIMRLFQVALDIVGPDSAN